MLAALTTVNPQIVDFSPFARFASAFSKAEACCKHSHREVTAGGISNRLVRRHAFSAYTALTFIMTKPCGRLPSGVLQANIHSNNQHCSSEAHDPLYTILVNTICPNGNDMPCPGRSFDRRLLSTVLSA